MNDPLYYRDCYLKEWKTRVKSVSDGKFVVLEDTAFYPVSGGQPHDTGTIKRSGDGKAFRVVYVGRFSGNVSHEVDQPGLSPGDEVECSLDWQRRYAFMRMHTAAHVLSKVIFDETRAVITGNQIGEDRTRIDFALDDFDRDKVQSWVDEANRIISESREVRIEFLNREEAMKIPDFVRQPDLIQKIDTLRIVNIKDLDIQPCGGAHVRNLKEIGGIRLLKTENKGKSNRRVYFSLD